MLLKIAYCRPTWKPLCCDPIRPPYTPNDCQANNEIILSRVVELISSMWTVSRSFARINHHLLCTSSAIWRKIVTSEKNVLLWRLKKIRENHRKPLVTSARRRLRGRRVPSWAWARRRQAVPFGGDAEGGWRPGGRSGSTKQRLWRSKQSNRRQTRSVSPLKRLG